MTSLPRISIVTPSFNQYAYLTACIASVEMQSYPEVEHLVLDGGSTDQTPAYLTTSPGCVTWWRSHRDGGQTQALNEGFSRVSGDWIGWQNSDDFYYPGTFWQLAEISQQHPEVQVIAGDTAIVTDHGVITHSTGIAPVPAVYWLKGHWPYNQSLFIRRDLLEQVLPLDESLHFHMDIEFFAAIALQTPRVAYINRILGAFRKYEGIKTDHPHHHQQIQQEKTQLRNRFHALMWPQSKPQWFLHRLRHHSYVFRAWGSKALTHRWTSQLQYRQPESICIL